MDRGGGTSRGRGGVSPTFVEGGSPLRVEGSGCAALVEGATGGESLPVAAEAGAPPFAGETEEAGETEPGAGLFAADRGGAATAPAAPGSEPMDFGATPDLRVDVGAAPAGRCPTPCTVPPEDAGGAALPARWPPLSRANDRDDAPGGAGRLASKLEPNHIASSRDRAVPGAAMPASPRRSGVGRDEVARYAGLLQAEHHVVVDEARYVD
jgi:hypothetical protein